MSVESCHDAAVEPGTRWVLFFAHGILRGSSIVCFTSRLSQVYARLAVCFVLGTLRVLLGIGLSRPCNSLSSRTSSVNCVHPVGVFHVKFDNFVCAHAIFFGWLFVIACSIPADASALDVADVAMPSSWFCPMLSLLNSSRCAFN